MVRLTLTFCKPLSLLTVYPNSLKSVGNESSCILKQTSSCLSLYDLLLPSGIKRLRQKSLIFTRFPPLPPYLRMFNVFV